MKKIFIFILMAMPFIGCSQLQWFNSYPSGSAINTPLVVLNSVTSGDPFCYASLNGTVTSDGGSAITERGFCYNTTGNPTTANNKIVVSGTVGNYTSSTSALTPLSLYYFKAYAINAAGTGYSADMSIATINKQSLSATDVDICNNNARDISVVITENGNTITDRRIRYGSSSTNENNVSVGAGGSTTIHLTSLTANTYYIYYVDTYAGSCRVSTYEQNFTTSNYTAPTTTTDLYNNVTNTTAGLYGTTTFDGNATITQKGFVYGLSANPTLADNIKYSTVNSSYFNETITGLTAGTAYHFRAFSTNCVSTAYGADMSFTTTGGNILATLSSSLDSETSDLVLVNWNLSLSSPSPSSVVIPITITNGNGVGTSTANFYIGVGQQTSSMTIPYSKLSTSYTAYANFGTMPSGFTGTNSTNYLIPALACSLPTIAFYSCSNVTSSSVQVFANISSDGGCAVTSRGFDYCTDGSFTTILGSVTVGSGIGSYNTTITGLQCNTRYYFRPWVTNSVGTCYGINCTDNVGTYCTTSGCPIGCPTVGDSYQGGIVAYIFQSGDNGYVSGECHGIIISSSDISSGIIWTNDKLAISGLSSSQGDGSNNTNLIVSDQSEYGITTYAAGLCSNYSYSGYTDWFLPSYGDWGKIYLGVAYLNLMPAVYYWTSSQFSFDQGWTLYSSSGVFYNINKYSMGYVRAIRNF